MHNQNRLWNTTNIIKIAMLAAIAFILMRVFKVPLPFFPSFLELDFSELPAIVATLTISPWAGIIVVILKNMLAVLNSYTGGVGELSNLLVGIGYILPLALMVRKNSSFKHTVTGVILGIAGMTVLGALTNYFITVPLFGEEGCVAAGAALNSAIVDKFTFVLYAITPFNIIKGTLVAGASVILVRGLQPVIKRLAYH